MSAKNDPWGFVEVLQQASQQGPFLHRLRSRLQEFMQMIEESDAEILSNGTVIMPEDCEPYHSPLWHAIEIVLLFERVAEAVVANDAHTAAEEGIRVGLMLREYDMKQSADISIRPRKKKVDPDEFRAAVAEWDRGHQDRRHMRKHLAARFRCTLSTIDRHLAKEAR